MSLKGKGIYPGQINLKTFALNMQAPMMLSISGEITANALDYPIGVVSVPSKITAVYLAVGDRGVDGSNPLAISGELLVNGSSALSTLPQISKRVAGDMPNACTYESASYLTQAVVSGSGEVRVGDVLSVNFKLTRTASPSTEIKQPSIIVELEPLV